LLSLVAFVSIQGTYDELQPQTKELSIAFCAGEKRETPESVRGSQKAEKDNI
jgi:hypothetical protein